MTVEEYRRKLIETFHKCNEDRFIALVAEPNERDFEELRRILLLNQQQSPKPPIK